MKTIFRLLCGWMAIALAACTGDELQQIEPLQKPVAQKTISVKAYTPSEQAATRLAFEDKGEDGLKLSWTAGDTFTALINNSKVTFTYDEDSKEFTADVNENFELSNGTIAYYPAYDGEIFVRDFSIQTGTLNGATTYMEGVYEGDAFRFTHSTAILKATFSGLPQNAVISSIQISGAVDITISNATISKDSIYINLPAIAKDGKLTFDVRTSDGTLYTATKTVAVVKGIETGVYYNTIVALSPAPVCNLPGYSTTEGKNLFNVAVNSFLNGKSLTKIKFVAKSSNTNKDNQIGTSGAYMVADIDNETLEIHTSAAEFVFNADCFYMFDGLSAITAIDFNNCINTANVTIMNAMFQNCSSLTSLDLSSFNTANVTNMAFMFQVCSELTSLNVSSFNTANVTDMNAMFNSCYALTSLDLSSFNTENVEYMSSMFVECYALTSLNVSSFNTANVENMSSMFSYCQKLASLDVSSFDFGNVTDFEDMFYDLGSEVTNKPIPVYVTMAGYEILNGKNSTTGIYYSSAQLVALCELPTGSSFNSAVNSFLNGKSLTKIKFVAKSSNTNKDNQISNSGAYMVAGSDNETLEIHTSGAEFVFNEDCGYMFAGLHTITAIDFNNCINTAKVTDMKYMFNNCSSLESLDLRSFNTEKVTNMASMFRGCSSLESLDLSSFNTGNVTSMTYMFYYCSSLQSITFGNSFNTANVTDMSYMFSHCSAFTSLDLSSFNTANVTNMTYMFRLCSALTSLNVSNFNTEKVTDMSNMFVGCYSLESLDLSSFDFGKVANFSGMFTDLGKNVSLPLVYIYVKDVNDKQKLDNANTYITKSRVIISVKQP